MQYTELADPAIVIRQDPHPSRPGAFIRNAVSLLPLSL